MNVETILRNKGNRVATIPPNATVADAVDMLNRERIGALVISEGRGTPGGGSKLCVDRGRYNSRITSRVCSSEAPTTMRSG